MEKQQKYRMPAEMALTGSCINNPNFEPNTRSAIKRDVAKRICHACFIENECLEEAISNPSDDGIKGGTSDKERRAIRSERKRAATLLVTDMPIEINQQIAS